MATPVSPARAGSDERLSRMVQIPTVETNGDEPFAAFEALLSADYPLVHEHLSREKVTDRGLLYHWKGASAERPVVLMAHYDVVPVEADGWDSDPFGGRIHDGIVWGRGTLDDKGPLLVVLEAVENLLADGFTPPHDVYLSFGGNEETYGDAAVAIADLFEQRGIVPWLVVDEGGAIVDAPLSFVPVESAMVGVGEKGIVTVRLTVAGTGGHASAPPRRSTAGRLARALRQLEKNPFAARMPRPFRQMIRAFEPHVSARYRLPLIALRTLHGPAARILAAGGGEPAALMHTTIATTMLEGGTAANVLPSSLSAVLNIRVAQGESTETVVATLRRAINDDSVRIEVLEDSAPSPLSATDNEQFALIRAAVDATYPGAVTAPYVMMAATDSRHFHRFAPAVYRFAPLAMTAEQRASIHGPNEHVTVDSLQRGERFFQTLLRSL
jgi:carboxypeptidase PM20D1